MKEEKKVSPKFNIKKWAFNSFVVDTVIILLYFAWIFIASSWWMYWIGVIVLSIIAGLVSDSEHIIVSIVISLIIMIALTMFIYPWLFLHYNLAAQYQCLGPLVNDSDVITHLVQYKEMIVTSTFTIFPDNHKIHGDFSCIPQKKLVYVRLNNMSATILESEIKTASITTQKTHPGRQIIR